MQFNMKAKRTYELVVYEREQLGRIEFFYGEEPELQDLADEMFAKGCWCELRYVWNDGHRTVLERG